MSEEDSDYSYVSDSDGSVGESKEVSLPESNPLLKRQLSLETEDPNEAYSEMKQMIQSTAAVLGVPDTSALTLLIEYRWDQTKLAADFVDGAERLLRKYNLPSMQKATSAIHQVDSDLEGMCPACWEDIQSDEDLFALQCGHAACKPCWQKTIVARMRNAELRMSCMEPSCNLPISFGEIKSLLLPDQFNQYREFLLNKFVSGNPFLRWCPNPRCNKILRARRAQPGNVRCMCGELFCGTCNAEPHDPLPCDLYRKWLDEVTKDSSKRTLQWIRGNTKPCPKCKSNIEKNGGCNHMSCSKCLHQFCWICFADWSSHASCVPAPTKKFTGLAGDALEMFFKYQAAFRGHEDSSQIEESHRKKIPEMARVIASKKADAIPSWVLDVEYILEDSLNTLIECRKFLRFCYPLAFYYFEKAKEYDIVVMFQQSLTDVTENLSSEFEKNPEELDLITLRTYKAAADHQLKRIKEGVEVGFEFSPSVANDAWYEASRFESGNRTSGIKGSKESKEDIASTSIPSASRSSAAGIGPSQSSTFSGGNGGGTTLGSSSGRGRGRAGSTAAGRGRAGATAGRGRAGSTAARRGLSTGGERKQTKVVRRARKR